MASDGAEAFLKALDYTGALLNAEDPARVLAALTAAYNYERDLLAKCKGKRLTPFPLQVRRIGGVGYAPLFLRMNAVLWCPMTLRLIALVVSTACLSVAQGPLRFELRRVERKTEGCGVITFEYPVIISAASPEARDRINAGILRVLLRGTDIGPPQYAGRSLDNYTAQFFKNCRDFRAREEDPVRELYEHKRVTIFRYTPPILSFRFDATADSGGVHPYGNTLFANFNSVTGKTVLLSGLLRDGGYAKLESIAETTFRQKYNLSPSDKLSESYSFPGDRFKLNENFGFGEDELVFIFNTYEIAPGAAGSIEIRLPYRLLSDAMKPGLRLTEW